MVTGPVNKAMISNAGYAFLGHTEYLAERAGTVLPVMLLATDELRVALATTHLALKDVPGAINKDLIVNVVRVIDQQFAGKFGIDSPRIGVCGLNPHAGEGGKMGREDLDLITPILERLNGQPAILTGPHSADTLFHAAARQNYDAAIAMYHDQALIPIKTLDFDQGVNLTLGLPFIRTSPDHGTALDIAGRGIANPNSCVAALRLAEELGQKR